MIQSIKLTVNIDGNGDEIINGLRLKLKYGSPPNQGHEIVIGKGTTNGWKLKFGRKSSYVMKVNICLFFANESKYSA